MWKFVFTNYAKRKFYKLDVYIQELILLKLKELKKQNLKEVNFRKLKGSYKIATHRLRIGKYRLIVLVEYDLEKVVVLDLGHRKNIYK